MPIIFCNLDHDWEFVTLVHDHCLDVYTDPEVEFWQVGAMGNVKPDCWGGWPRRIARKHLLAELLEAGRLLAEPESLLLLVSAAAPDPELDQELATLANEAWWKRCTAVLALPADDQTAIPAPRAPWRLTLQLDSEPRKRLYGLRLLGEWLSQDNSDPRWLPQGGVFRLGLENGSRTPLSDCVMHYWPEYAEELLKAADEVQRPDLKPWRQKVEETYRAAFELLGANPDQLDQRESFLDERLDDQALRQGAAPWGSELTEPTQKLLQWRVPRFYDPKLLRDIHQNLNEWTDALDRTLTERYASLHQTQQPEKAQQLQREREHRGALDRHRAWTLGISEETINQIEHDRAKLSHYRSAIRRRVERLTAFLRHRVESSVRRRAPVFGDSDYRYRRQWLEADAALHDARRTAITAARRLVNRTAFWGGLATVTGLALLPVLILRIPLLTGAGGVSQYFNNPAWWGPDCAWTVLFALIYLAFALHQIHQRRRRLRIAQDGLRNAATELWRQNMEIFGNLFRYQDHSQAQRLLTALDEHCERLSGELAQTQTHLNALRRDLQRQRDYYQTLSPLPPTTGHGLGKPFNGQDSRSLSPLQWLKLCLEPEDWRRLPEQEITANGPDPLKSRYLRNPPAAGSAQPPP